MGETNRTAWSRDVWDGSISAKAYNADWLDFLTPTREPALWTELKTIWQEEQNLPKVPAWAEEIITRMLELPMCGHYTFPANVIQILDAIARKRCPDVVMRCYTVDPHRKTLMSYYIFCLDAWVKNAPHPTVISELVLRNSLGKDWSRITNAIYDTLGVKTDLKRVTVQRLIHRLRWWTKTLIWDGDKRDRFLLDFYGGDVRGDEAKWGAYGNSPYGDPYFTELQLPHVQSMEQRILDEAPDGQALLVRIQSTWLCAPKVFRYLEKLIAEIGAIDSGPFTGDVPSFLQCESTYPDFSAYQQKYLTLVSTLRQWLDGDDSQLPDIEPGYAVNRWLVHLLWHKVFFQGTYEENFRKLVGGGTHGKSGSKKPENN